MSHLHSWVRAPKLRDMSWKKELDICTGKNYCQLQAIANVFWRRIQMSFMGTQRQVFSHAWVDDRSGNPVNPALPDPHVVFHTCQYWSSHSQGRFPITPLLFSLQRWAAQPPPLVITQWPGTNAKMASCLRAGIFMSSPCRHSGPAGAQSPLSWHRHSVLALPVPSPYWSYAPVFLPA